MTVNFWLIVDALAGILAYCDDEEIHQTIDSDSEAEVCVAVTNRVKPLVSTWPRDRQESLRLALAYYLHHPEVLERKVLANLVDVPITQPTDVTRFFERVWHALYPQQDYRAVDVRNAIEDNDPLVR